MPGKTASHQVYFSLSGWVPSFKMGSAAVLICVKTAAILGAVLALGPLKEEDYKRLVKVSLERKEQLVGMNGCSITSWIGKNNLVVRQASGDAWEQGDRQGRPYISCVTRRVTKH